MKVNNYWAESRIYRNAPDAPGGAPEADPPVEQTEAPDPLAWVPETFRTDDAVDTDGFLARFQELEAEAASRQEQIGAVPESPDGYEIGIPEDIDFGDMELPEGFKFELSDDPAIEPILNELKATLHKHQLPPTAAGEFMGVLAKYEASRVAQGLSAAKAEMDTLGSAAQSRISNIARKLDASLPADQASALKAATTTAAGVKALEAIFRPRSMAAPASQPATPDLEAMTPRQRLDYANSSAAQGRR